MEAPLALPNLRGDPTGEISELSGTARGVGPTGHISGSDRSVEVTTSICGGVGSLGSLGRGPLAPSFTNQKSSGRAGSMTASLLMGSAGEEHSGSPPSDWGVTLGGERANGAHSSSRGAAVATVPSRGAAVATVPGRGTAGRRGIPHPRIGARQTNRSGAAS